MDFTELPEEIGNLRFLQTLILGKTKTNQLPQSIGLLRQLRCLHVTYKLTTVSTWIGNLTSLEELYLSTYVSLKVVKELGKLAENSNHCKLIVSFLLLSVPSTKAMCLLGTSVV